MMSFPVTLTFNTKEEYDSYLLEHRGYIENLFYTDEERAERESKVGELTEKLHKSLEVNNNYIEKIEKLEELVELSQKRDVGECSVYKGEFCEKATEMILNESFGEKFEIDGSKVKEKMDIRMISKEKDYCIGIELKEKKKLTKKEDLDKFLRDKTVNDFKGSVFISTQAPIGNIVEEKDTFKIEGDALYIYSANTELIIIIMHVYIQYLELEQNDEKNILNERTDMIVSLYNGWCNFKKYAASQDKLYTKYLKDIGINLSNGHIYLVSKSKCKCNKIPY